jgi:cation/acetate symporter
MGIFIKSMNREGAIAGMLAGMGFTWTYIVYFKFIAPEANTAANWFMGISPEGIGFVGMMVNFAVALTVVRHTAKVPARIGRMVEAIRIPSGQMQRDRG